MQVNLNTESLHKDGRIEMTISLSLNKMRKMRIELNNEVHYSHSAKGNFMDSNSYETGNKMEKIVFIKMFSHIILERPALLDLTLIFSYTFLNFDEIFATAYEMYNQFFHFQQILLFYYQFFPNSLYPGLRLFNYNSTNRRLGLSFPRYTDLVNVNDPVI